MRRTSVVLRPVPSGSLQIQYPPPLTEDCHVVLIRDAPSGGPYTRPGCSERLVARRGEQRASHFAHYNDATKCDPDNTLHSAAQRLIADASPTAVAEARPTSCALPAQSAGNGSCGTLRQKARACAPSSSCIFPVRSSP